MPPCLREGCSDGLIIAIKYLYYLLKYLHFAKILIYKLHTDIGLEKPVPGDRMEIIRGERTYEGIHAIPSTVMAVMESSGIRRHLDDLCKEKADAACFLSPGMAVKAMVGAMVERGKRPLYRVSDYYSTAPADKLFGPMVDNGSLSDTVLAQRLDTVFSIDTRKALHDCYLLLKEKYGFTSDTCFMDASNYTMYGLKYVETQMNHDQRLAENGITVKESPIPAFGGNAKDGHNDRVQLDIGHVVDANGIPMFSQSYDGNTSDIRINEDLIRFIFENIDVHSMILMADCKLCTEDILSSLMSTGMAFVTKVPLNFNDKLKESVIESVASDCMDESRTRSGRRFYQTATVVDGRSARVIAYILPGAEAKASKFIEGPGLEKARRKLKSLKSRRFFCKEDAMDAFRQTLGSLDADCYAADPVVYEDREAEKRHGDGKLFRVRAEDVRVDARDFEVSKTSGCQSRGRQGGWVEGRRCGAAPCDPGPDHGHPVLRRAVGGPEDKGIRGRHHRPVSGAVQGGGGIQDDEIGHGYRPRLHPHPVAHNRDGVRRVPCHDGLQDHRPRP